MFAIMSSSGYFKIRLVDDSRFILIVLKHLQMSLLNI